MEKYYEKKIRVLVVDDSAFMRKVISDILDGDDDIEVVDTAKNGFDAIEKVKELKPDVITLDVKMPGMDGLACLKELNKISKTPVVMLSSVTKEGAEATIQALADGAIDFITKPSNIFEMNGIEKSKEIIEKIKIANNLSKNYYSSEKQKVKNKNVNNGDCNVQNLVLIGTSTGGPKALQDVIPLIPENVNAAFLIVQHMPAGFTKSLADRLDNISKINVKEAEDSEVIRTGYVYIAPGDYHMMVEKNVENTLKIKLTKDPPLGGHRPSVDIMFESVSNTGFKNVVAAIMTGMGGDGSEGVKILKKINGAHIIAQDEASCVVFGMPRVAILTGVVDIVTPLKEISNEIMKIVGVHK
ncbi:MAG: Chemotaxis response regulator protein-glutamate methylesterase [Firmicutes bacterium ADurb.Bin419]|nr:MAG: Chemotaxis response regulator protein-glutamate methylesterase [Firmicutes bacterium ADurb.Bin419]